MASSSQGNRPDNGENGTGQKADKGKGKGKEEPLPSTQQDASPGDDGGSLVSRIANSTVGLASAMLSGAPSSSVLAGAVSEKGSTSTAAASAPQHEETTLRFRPDITTGSQSFRASQAQTHAAAEEAAFSDFLDSTPVFQPAGSSEMETAWKHSSAVAASVSLGGHDTTTFSSVAEQESHDGGAVVALLADANEHLPDHLEDDILQPEERESLRKALFGQSTGPRGQESDWNHVLNFLPDSLRQAEDNGYATMDSYMLSGHSDPEEAWQTWVGQWHDVLTRYNDEVWGDLGSLVEEARREVEQLAQAPPDGPPPDTKALRRLRAILGHLRGE